jgi:hypothetical protein
MSTISEKIGFVHLPRTGGTYLEGVLCSLLSPEEFINFFGTPTKQIPNKLGIIERIAADKERQSCLLKIPNWPTSKLFSGHFSLNIQDFLPKEYSYSYATMIRNPLTRVYSFVKKVTTSGGFHRCLTINDIEPIGSDMFWNNFIEYYKTDSRIGLSNHERNGFSNYMTKVFSGSDLSKSDIVVNDHLYNKARQNLNKMKYIGIFENYKESVIEFLKIFNLEYPRLTIRESANKNITNSTITNFIESINQYDIKLYKEFSK